MPPLFSGVDHVHIHVTDRVAATEWFERVMGLRPIQALEFWAVDGGPLTLSDAGGSVHFALFESAPQASRATIALGATAGEFIAWQRHLSAILTQPVEFVDHNLSWSIYFKDPDGNPFEVTTFEYAAVAAVLPMGA